MALQGRFFIDYVDTEYCLRAKRNGLTVIILKVVMMEHKLGNPKKCFSLLRRIILLYGDIASRETESHSVEIKFPCRS